MIGGLWKSLCYSHISLVRSSLGFMSSDLGLWKSLCYSHISLVRSSLGFMSSDLGFMEIPMLQPH